MSQLNSLLETMGGVIRYVGISLMALGIVACVAPLMSGLAIAVIVGLVLLAGLLIGSKLISSGWAIMRVHRALESAGDRLRSAREGFASRSVR